MSAIIKPISAPKASGSNIIERLRERVEDSDALSTLVAVFDQAMISGTNFVTAIIIGRCCGAETLGIYSLVAAAMAMVIGLQDQLITAPYVLYHNRKRGRTLQRYLGSSLVHHAFFLMVTFLGMLVCLGGVQSTTPLVKSVTLVLTIAAPAIILRAWIREIALAHCYVVTVLIIDAIVCTTQLAAVLGMFALGVVNLTAIYSVLGLACLLTALVWMKSQRHRFVFSTRSVKLDWQRNWRFGRWALATHLAGTSTPYVMPWVLFMMHGEEATGYLASCSVIVGVANILLSGMSDFLAPRAAAAYAQGGVKQLRKILRSMAILGTLTIGSVAAIATLFGEEIINTLYDGRFPGAGDIAALMALSVLANALGSVAGNGLWAIDKPRANFVADMVTLTVAIAAAPAMVGPYGAKGAAMATLSACATGAVIRLLIFQSHCGTRGTKNVSRDVPEDASVE